MRTLEERILGHDREKGRKRDVFRERIMIMNEGRIMGLGIDSESVYCRLE